MDTTGTLFLPPQSSTVASDVDSLFNLVLYVGIFFFALVVGLSLYFAIKYRRREEQSGLTSPIDHSLNLELLWTIIPTVIVSIIFVLRFTLYMKMKIAPKDALEIKVTAQRWFWTFDYPNGANSMNDLVVPAGKPIKLLMSSTDVIHSLFIPDFRVKMDVLPNRYTSLWFDAPNPGEHVIECAGYCGKGHSEMTGRVRVLNQREYDDWLQQSSTVGSGMSPEEYGESLYNSKRCITCHSIDGSPNVGPTLQGIFGANVNLEGGKSVLIDENYIRESILDPQAKIVKGYQPVMPTFQGLLKSKDIDALIAYIKSLNKQRGK